MITAGLRLESHKARAMQRPLQIAGLPASAVVPLDQGGGTTASPAVRPGMRVRIGTAIARPGDSRSATVHSPVAGIVRDIGVRDIPTPSGQALCIVIENDGTDEWDIPHAPTPWALVSPARLIDGIREAGIVGLGGAAFPTSIKLRAAREQSVEHLVLNGAECEPWISCDDALMRERAGDVVIGAQVMMHACGARRATIAVEDDKPEAIAALQTALSAASDDRIALLALPALYPAGAERQLLSAVTGREVPYDELPPAIGLVCQNVGTAAAVAAWVRTGQPCISRIVTITGSGVNQPANLEARIGTPLSALVAECGGYCGQPRRLIAGGSMTGQALTSDALPLTKAMNCVLVATGADLAPRGREMPCIRCGDCATACPAGLLPQQLHRGVLSDDAELFERHGLADCIECGCCDFVCPSQIPLTSRFREARAQARARREEMQRAADARQRFEQRERRLAARAEVERRAFDEARRRARGDGPPSGGPDAI